MKELIDVSIGYPFPLYPVPLTSDLIQSIVAADPETVIWVGAAVEPSIAVNPTNAMQIVAAWQQNRISNGGAVFIGIGYSHDGGKTWKQTFAAFPSELTFQRQTDAWLSWDISGQSVYLNVYAWNTVRVPGNGPNQENISSWVSHDFGATWSTYRSLVTSQSTTVETTPQLIAPSFDKNSVTADNHVPGIAYSAWDAFPNASSYHSDSWVAKTVDSGKHWTSLLAYDPFFDPTLPSNGIYECVQTINNVIVQSRPIFLHPKTCFTSVVNANNCVVSAPAIRATRSTKTTTLFNFMVRTYATPTATEEQYLNDTFPYQYTAQDLAFVTSHDGGTTWSKTATVIAPLSTQWIFTAGYSYDADGNITGAACSGADPTDYTCRIRNDALIPSQTINPCNGRLYVAYQSPSFRADHMFQIAVQESRDNGLTWSTPFRASQTPVNAPNPQAFCPVIAATAGGYVGVMYADFRNDSKQDPTQTLTDFWLAIYKSNVSNPLSVNPSVSGLQFVREVRLTPESYVMQNGPRTTQGIMTSGDYCSLVTQGETFFALYTHSLPGPFVAPIPGTHVDCNHRNDVFFSRIPARAPVAPPTKHCCLYH